MGRILCDGVDHEAILQGMGVADLAMSLTHPGPPDLGQADIVIEKHSQGHRRQP